PGRGATRPRGRSWRRRPRGRVPWRWRWVPWDHAQRRLPHWWIPRAGSQRVPRTESQWIQPRVPPELPPRVQPQFLQLLPRFLWLWPRLLPVLLWEWLHLRAELLLHLPRLLQQSRDE